MTIGERIRMRREELNMTQEELACKLGYKSRTSINKIELGLYNLPTSKINLAAEALQTTPRFIMDWNESDEVEVCDDCKKESYKAMTAYYKLDKKDRLSIYNKMLKMLQNKKYSDK